MNEKRKTGLYMMLGGVALLGCALLLMYVSQDAVPNESSTATSTATSTAAIATTTTPAATTTDVFAMEPIVPEAKVSTEGWKTCRNEEYGYEFKFPAEWHIYGEDVLGMDKGLTGESKECNGQWTLITDRRAELSMGGASTDSYVTVLIQDVTNNPKVSKNLEELVSRVDLGAQNYSLYSVDHAMALFYINENPRNQFPNEEWGVSVFIGNLFYDFTLHSLSQDPERAVLETILSTLHFLDKESTSTEAEAQ